MDIDRTSTKEPKPVLTILPARFFHLTSALDIVKGTFGEVKMYMEYESGKEVAIKVTLGTNRAYLNNAAQEVKLLTRLNSDDPKGLVVRLLEDFMDAGHHCLVMEVARTNLALWLWGKSSSKGPMPAGMPLDQLAVVGRRMVCALEFLEERKVVHGDIRPSNFLVMDKNDPGASLKLCDFGSSVVLEGGRESMQTLDKRMGCVQYRSPEMLLGYPSNFAVDMWSLAHSLLHLVMGRPFFVIENEMMLMDKICVLIGKPPRHMLEGGKHTGAFFKKRSDRYYPRFIEESRWLQEGKRPTTLASLITRKTHGDACYTFPVQVLKLYDLLERMLTYDPCTRITAGQALKHAFFHQSQAQ